MKSFQFIDDQLATISFSVTKTLRDKPMIVGATILDLAKRFMFQFHYQKMKPNLNLELLYSDTDSFIYAIKTDDVYRDLEKIKADFDFSNYYEDHFQFDDNNQKTVQSLKTRLVGTRSENSSLMVKKSQLEPPFHPHSSLSTEKLPLPLPLSSLPPPFIC